jgi:type IV pilus assembly protein PilC
MDFFSPRIGLKPLANLCHRLATSLEAGVDARTVWSRETDRAVGAMRRNLAMVSQGANRGQSLTESREPTDDYFPAIFREMAAVGEQTGHLDGVFAQLADHYQTQLTMRRMFFGAIAWPMFQLIVALGVVGLAIWVAGMLPKQPNGKPLDLFGFGLVGTAGLRTYLMIVGGIVAAVWLTIRAMQRGLVWTRPIQRFVLSLPGVGRPLQTLALSRLAWSLHLTMNTGMDVRRALKLSLRSTQNARYIDQIPEIDAEIMAGNSIHDAFSHVGGYPVEFLDTLAVGEQTGKTVESMGHLAKQYLEQAKAVMAVLATLAGVGVWLVIAAMLIVLIFRVFFTAYLNPINDALRGMGG